MSRNRVIFDLPEKDHWKFSEKVFKGMRSAVLSGLVKAFLKFLDEEGIEKIGYVAQGKVSLRIETGKENKDESGRSSKDGF